MRASLGWLFVSLWLAGCARQPEPLLVPLPPQRQLVNAPDLPYQRNFVFMSEARASAMIVRDIAGPGVQRWTAAQPAMRFSLPEPGEWIAEVRFHAAQATLKDTGPITLSFFVDGRPIGALRIADDAEKVFSAPVRVESTQTELGFTVDKPWIAPEDGATLGVLLHAMGFKRSLKREGK